MLNSDSETKINQILDYVHSEHETLLDASGQTDEQREWAERITRLYKWVAHSIVLADAMAGDVDSWAPLRQALNIANHCWQCTMHTLAGFVAIVAEDTYKLSPGLTRDEFVVKYGQIHGLDD